MITAHPSGCFRQPSQEATPTSCPVPTCNAKSPAAASVTLQRLEALEWDARGPRDELQEPGPPLLIKGLHGLPEPPDDAAVGSTVLQPRVGLPVAHVYFIQAAYYQLGGVGGELLLTHVTSIRAGATQASRRLALSSVAQTPPLALAARVCLGAPPSTRACWEAVQASPCSRAAH